MKKEKNKKTNKRIKDEVCLFYLSRLLSLLSTKYTCILDRDPIYRCKLFVCICYYVYLLSFFSSSFPSLFLSLSSYCYCYSSFLILIFLLVFVAGVVFVIVFLFSFPHQSSSPLSVSSLYFAFKIRKNFPTEMSCFSRRMVDL